MGFYLLSTPDGWVATVWTKQGLGGLVFPHADREEALAALRNGFIISGRPLAVYEGSSGNSTVARLEEKLNLYFQGKAVSFSSIPVDLSWCTPFQRMVLESVRQIGYGELWSYQQVAAAAHRPRAARAVGGVLGENRVPLVIPCHRVVRSDGSLGGFGWGTAMKSRLLALEGCLPECGSRYRLTNTAHCGSI